MTKGMAVMLMYTTKECNYNFIVTVHQHGGYDVTCKPRIDSLFHNHARAVRTSGLVWRATRSVNTADFMNQRGYF